MQSDNSLRCLCQGWRCRNLLIWIDRCWTKRWVTSKPTSVEDTLVTRIDRLESLLLSVVSKPPPFQPSDHPFLNHEVDHECAIHAGPVPNGDGRSLKQLSKEFGVMKIEPNQTVYLGREHWVSLMSQVRPVSCVCLFVLMTKLDSWI